jgi:hypothetical protein
MIVCSHCDSINRLSEARSALEAKCGRCGRKLFAASPQDVSGTTFERLRGANDHTFAGGCVGSLVRSLPRHGTNL